MAQSAMSSKDKGRNTIKHKEGKVQWGCMVVKGHTGRCDQTGGVKGSSV